MLDRLPPELVDHILDLLPSPAKLDGVHERTIALRACCVVSKALRDRAESLLWRDVAILRWDQADRALLRFKDANNETKERLSGTRSLRLGVEDQLFHVDETFDILAFSPGLRELRLECQGDLDMSLLANSVSNLEILALNRSITLRSSASFVFPYLTNLSLNRTDLLPSFATNIFATFTSALPSLRALAISPNHEPTEPHIYEILFDAKSPAFLGRRSTLDMLQLHLKDITEFSKPVFYSEVPTVITVTNNSLASQRMRELLSECAPSHVRYYHSPSAPTRLDIFAEGLMRLLLLVHVPSRPKSLHVPSCLRPEPSERIAEPQDALFAACERKGVEVVWYDLEEEDEREVSPSFWRYAMGIKAEKEKEETR
ncbi:hypothetical protein JCM8547_000353 [Rhodosporidiobolus lusitaniae]